MYVYYVKNENENNNNNKSNIDKICNLQMESVKF